MKLLFSPTSPGLPGLGAYHEGDDFIVVPSREDGGRRTEDGTRLIDVIEGTRTDLDTVYDMMEQDFPPDECLAKDRIEQLMSQSPYKLLLAKRQGTPEIVGYAFIYVPQSPEVIWLDYMAITQTCRGAGYGTLLFNRVCEDKLRQGASLGVFIEVEPVSESDSDVATMQKKRIAFYERLDAIRIPCDYQLPTEDGGMSMHLYFRPSAGVHLLPARQIQETIAAAYDYIHGDKPHRTALCESVIRTVQDLHC